MKIKKLIIAILLVSAVVSGCTANNGVAENTVYVTPTPIPYEQFGYYDTYPGVTDIVFNTTNIQDVGGEQMPVYANGSEIAVSITTDVITSNLVFDVQPMPYNQMDNVSDPIVEPVTVSYTDGGYQASFTDNNNCLLGYYMSFTDPETDIIYFDAIVACGDISIIGQ